MDRRRTNQTTAVTLKARKSRIRPFHGVLLALIALTIPASAAQDDPTVRAQSDTVRKNGQTSNEQPKLPANIDYQGPPGAKLEIFSMSFTPEGDWKFRKFKEGETDQTPNLNITGSGSDYVDMDTGNPTPQSPVAAFESRPFGDLLSAAAAFPESIDAGKYPLKMEGNLTHDQGDGGEEKH